MTKTTSTKLKTNKVINMNLTYLKTFLTLAETLSFTKTADLLHLSQTSVSRQIFSLESELNIQLFIRNHKDVQLTEAGYEFAQRVKPLITGFDDALLAAQYQQIKSKSSLCIGLGIYESFLLRHHLQLFQCQNPKLKFKIIQTNYDELLQQLHMGTFDIAFTSDQFLNDLRPGFQKFLIWDQPWSLMISTKSSLNSQKIIKLKTLNQHTLITMSMINRAGLIDFYRPYFIVNQIMQVNSFQSKMLAVSANLGFGLIPSFVPEHSNQDVIFKTTDIPIRTRKFYAVIPPKPKKIAEDLIELCIKR